MTRKQIKGNNIKIIIFVIIISIITLGFIFLLSSSSERKNTCEGDSCNVDVSTVQDSKKGDFLGEKGINVKAEGTVLYIEESEVNNGNIHFYNYVTEKDEKTMYFFIIRANDGSYRVAANACEVCFDAKRGFKQIGDSIQCVNCRTTYTKDQIAMQKGGCNPGPIEEKAQIVDGRLAINVSDIESVAYLFN